MEEFQTKQKSNFFMGLICLIAGALATCVLYFGISRLGYFSFWVSAIGITISVMGYNHYIRCNTKCCRDNLWRIFGWLC